MRVYYSDDMVTNEPNALMPQLILDDWILHGIMPDKKAPIAITVSDIALAHNINYVKEVLDCKTNNGFGNTSKDIAKTLQHATAALYRAAAWILRSKSLVAMSLGNCGSNAGFDYGNSGSTFNSLIITARKLERKELISRIGILDLSQQYGKGTDELISKFKLKWVAHFSASIKGFLFNKAENSDKFLKLLPKIIESQFKSKDILLVQFGNCNWLTPEQHVERDRIVFETCKKLEIPVVWSFDFNSKNLESYRKTMLECIKIYGEGK